MRETRESSHNEVTWLLVHSTPSKACAQGYVYEESQGLFVQEDGLVYFLISHKASTSTSAEEMTTTTKQPINHNKVEDSTFIFVV